MAKRISQIVGVLLFIIIMNASSVFALTRADLNSEITRTPYFDPTATACTTGSITLTGSANAEKIWHFFIDQGFQPFQVAGLMGNMQAESGFNPRRVQGTATPSGDKDNITVDGKTGYGLVQWTSKGRQQGLADAASAAGVISGDLGVQLQYIMKEFPSGSQYHYNEFRATTSLEDATEVVLQHYETPADIPGQRVIRLGFARSLLVQFGGGASDSSDSTGTPAESAAPASSCGGAALAGGVCPTGPVTADQITTVQGIRVHPCIAQEVDRIITLAKSQGLHMSGSGYRDPAGQIAVRRTNCGPTHYDIYEKPSGECHPPTAIPGSSRHESGTAVDFTCDGTTIKNHSQPCFIFLEQNTSLKNFDREPWHWSYDGH